MPAAAAPPGSLNAAQRGADLRRMAESTLDLLVVGGGVVGAGAALDAASRGLATGLIEAADFAGGSSSRSSRLAHGGLRYLEHRQFGLVAEALRERRTLIETLCPHLARPVSFLLPLRRPLIDRVYLGAGVALYDLLAARRGLGRHRHLSRDGALERFAGLDPRGLRGGLLYQDAQIDDARHTLALARTAALRGAAVAGYAELASLTHAGDHHIAEVIDHESGDRLEVRARRVVIAAGVWSEEVQRRLKVSGVSLAASKGVHLVVPRERIPGDVAVISRTRSSVVLILPWGRHWLIGTTDTAWAATPAQAVASAADIDYLLTQANRILARPLGRADITGVYAGLRPLLHDDGSTSSLSREHQVVEVAPGVVVVAGGKYTTYRPMAAEAVDVAVEGLGVEPSSTERLPLVGAQGMDAARAALADESDEEIERLIRRHGGQAEALAPSLGAPVGAGHPLRRGEVAWACRHEGALRLGDVMRHRSRLEIEAGDDGLGLVEGVADEMSEALGWSRERRARELSTYRDTAAAGRAAEAAPTDAMARALYSSSS